MSVDPAHEPFIDLVQVRTGTSFGSGLLIGKGLVITALHCVADPEKGWASRGPVGVYLWRDLKGIGRAPVERPLLASLRWRAPETARPVPDFAVLAIAGADAPSPMAPARPCALPQAELDAFARGFPFALAANKGAERQEGSFAGSVSYQSFSGRSLAYKTGLTPSDREGHTWKGLSGGPVLIDGMVAGVMREVPERWDGSMLLAEPLELLLSEHADLRPLLNVTGPRPVPGQRPAAPPAAEFDRLWELVFSLDRDDEVGHAEQGLQRWAGVCPTEILVSGHPLDLCDEFYKRLWREKLGPRQGARQRFINGVPPPAMNWPRTGDGLVAAERVLASDTLRRLGSDYAFGDLNDVQEDLRQAPPPWLCIHLPATPTTEDRALLKSWRRAWAGLPAPRRQPVGYVLVHDGGADAAQAFELGTGYGEGLAQVRVSLREITSAEVDAWQGSLAESEAGMVGANLTPLSLVAARLAARLREAGRTCIRLGDLKNMIGGVAEWQGDAWRTT